MTYFVIVCKIILTPPIQESVGEGRGVQKYISRNYVTFSTFSLPPAYFSAKLIALALAGPSRVPPLSSPAPAAASSCVLCALPNV